MAIMVSKKSPQQSQVTKSPVTAKSSGPSWFKKGDATQTAIQQEEKRIEEQQAQKGKMWRFWLEKGESAAVTFVDGFLTDKGILDCFMYREHSLMLNGKWGNHFVCTSEQEPCPICEVGDNPSLVGVFTIIDHREYTSKKGDKFTDTPRLFVAKRGTLKQLQQLASKRDGLAGCTFDVSRMGEQAAAVGDVFDFTEKQEVSVLRKKFVREIKDAKSGKSEVKSIFVPADYTEEITYRTADEIRALGIGKAPIGSESGPVMGAKHAGKNVDEALG